MVEEKEKPKLPKEEPIKTREIYNSKVVLSKSKDNKKD